MNKETQTRLTLECNDGHRYIWESPYFDEGIDNIIEAFHGLLVASGWPHNAIVENMAEFVEVNKPEQTEE